MSLFIYTLSGLKANMVPGGAPFLSSSLALMRLKIASGSTVHFHTTGAVLCRVHSTKSLGQAIFLGPSLSAGTSLSI